MIVYARTDGFAHDLRYEDGDYILKLAEFKYADGFGTLPPLETLHDPAAVQAKLDAEEAERQRLLALKADALAADLIARLRNATPEQINNYINNNVISLESAKTVLKQILLVLALLARQFNG